MGMCYVLVRAPFPWPLPDQLESDAGSSTGPSAIKASRSKRGTAQVLRTSVLTMHVDARAILGGRPIMIPV